MKDMPPPLPAELVQEMVMVAHGDEGRVTALLADHPALANACWDWGGGDFETALGAAAHTGSRGIAERLLVAGARLDLFAAAMLGYLDLVRAAVDACPAARHAPGPHGIPLAVHAQMGGERAAAVADYLSRLGEDA
jgi:hypothetical protein